MPQPNPKTYLRCFLLLIACVALAFLTLTAYAVDVKTYIPKQAPAYLPVVDKEVTRLMPAYTLPHYFGGLVEQESCISLTHSRCWNPKSALKTSREEGAGLGQITKAYNPNGSLRFDLLTEMNRRHGNELKELSWANVYQRPDLQIRAIVLTTRENHNALFEVKDAANRTALADSAYNGGLGGLKKERLQCRLTKGCDPQQWFGHVERVCLKSKKPLYGDRSACDINREHVSSVIRLRMGKYKPYFNHSSPTNKTSLVGGNQSPPLPIPQKLPEVPVLLTPPKAPLLERSVSWLSFLFKQ